MSSQATHYSSTFAQKLNKQLDSVSKRENYVRISCADDARASSLRIKKKRQNALGNEKFRSSAFSFQCKAFMSQIPDIKAFSKSMMCRTADIEVHLIHLYSIALWS